MPLILSVARHSRHCAHACADVAEDFAGVAHDSPEEARAAGMGQAEGKGR
jgi:hypothetical protein